MSVKTYRRNTEVGAYRASISLDFEEIVAALVSLIGKKLTLYIASRRDPRTLESWIGGTPPDRSDIEARLRLAFRIAKLLQDAGESARTIQAWLIGLNPELQDRVPSMLLREGAVDEKDGVDVLNAARAYVMGG